MIEEISKPKQSSTPLWKILLAIVFFPLTLTYLIWKQKWQIPVKLGLTFLLWVVFFGLSSDANKEKTQAEAQPTVVVEKPTPTPTPEPVLTLEQKLEKLAKKEINKDATLKFDQKTGAVVAEISTANYTFFNNTDIANSVWKFFIPFAKEAFTYEGINEIKVTITTEFIDSYGKSLPGEAAHINMSKEDFQLFNWDNLRFSNPKENQELLDKSNYFVHGIIYKDIDPKKLKISFL